VNYFSARLHAALWWLLPLAALAVMIGGETDWGRAIDKRPQPAEAGAPTPVVASLLPEFAIPGGLAARTETVQRTLFNPTRRPAPAAAQDNANARIQRGQFALTGTTIVDGRSTAFLREVAGNKSRRVHAGETINGMRVAEVKPDRVKFTLGDDSEELVLKVATNPRPTAPPAAVAQAATLPPGVAQAATLPPGVAQAAAPPGVAPPGTLDAAQTLAERRRAARAAAAAAVSPAAPPAAAGAPAPVAPAGGVDPRWQQMDQRYRGQAATGNRGTAQ